jgi:hypothetical protein
MPSDNNTEYGLVMPFVSVASVGGPHDDQAYVAGWEMGMLDAELRYARPPLLDRVIHRSNCRQVDLIAMKYGYSSRVEDYDQQWSYLSLTQKATEGGPL